MPRRDTGHSGFFEEHEMTFTDGLILLLSLAPIACIAWLGMIWVAFRWFGIHPKEVLREITLPESVFFSGYAFSSAYLVASVFSRFL